MANNVVRATLTTSEVTVCATAAQSHIGTLRVSVRVYATSTDVRIRLAWQDGASGWRSNAYATPPAANDWVELDLGTVTVSKTLAGTQAWTGRINALSSTVGDTLDVDTVEFFPTDVAYGKLKASQTFETVTAFAARDEFSSDGSLNGKTAPAGGTWAVSSGTLTVAGGVAYNATNSTAPFALLGSTTYTSILVQADVEVSSGAAGNAGIVLRTTDSNTYLWANVTFNFATPGSPAYLILYKRIGGGSITSSSVGIQLSSGIFYSIRALVDAAGRYYVWLWEASGAAGQPVLAGQDADLATGGSLASGKIGIWDAVTAPGTHTYDNFFAAVPQANDVLASGRTLQVRTDGAIHQDSTGTYSGNVPVYGTYPTIPPAGAELRTTRIAARGLRNNPAEMGTGATNTDSLAVQAIITPRYLTPR